MQTQEWLDRFTKILRGLGEESDIAAEQAYTALRAMVKRDQVNLRDLSVVNQANTNSRGIVHSDGHLIGVLRQQYSTAQEFIQQQNARIHELERRLNIRSPNDFIVPLTQPISHHLNLELVARLDQILIDYKIDLNPDQKQLLRTFNLFSIFEQQQNIPEVFIDHTKIGLPGYVVRNVRSAYLEVYGKGNAFRLFLSCLLNIPHTDPYQYIEKGKSVIIRNWGSEKKAKTFWWGAVIIRSGHLQDVLQTMCDS
jgi:hypothetical protein